jgi:flagellar basal-body rod modification protein FlgD
MSSIDTGNSYIDSLRGSPTSTTGTNGQKEANKALTQADFFALLTQQLAFQDPTKPVENDQMIAQMTNFTMADGISSLNSNFKDFASSMNSNQALQASSLVGRTVLVASDQLVYDGKSAAYGTIDFPANATGVSAKIYDSAGALVQTVTMDSAGKGKQTLSWDGTNAAGEKLPAGLYTIKVDASINGKNEAVPTAAYVKVNSVSLNNAGGLTLNLLGIGAKKLSDVQEIAAG